MSLFDDFCHSLVLEISQSTVNSAVMQHQQLKDKNPIAGKREASFFKKSQDYARVNNSLVRFRVVPVDALPNRSFEFFVSGKIDTDSAAMVFKGVSYTADEKDKNFNALLITNPHDYSVHYIPDITVLTNGGESSNHPAYSQGEFQRRLGSERPSIPWEIVKQLMKPVILQSSTDAKNLRLSVIKYFNDQQTYNAGINGPESTLKPKWSNISNFRWKSLPFLDEVETKINKFGQTEKV